MKRIFFLITIILSVHIIIAQTFGSHKVAITPTAFPQTDFDKEAYKEKLYKKFSAKSKSAELEEYINEDIIYKEYFFNSNQVYTNWPEATEYVKKVFELTIPKNFNINEVKIYVVRDPEPNAFCMEDGHIAVTAGFLSSMQNEAELAAIFCHEFGHYYANHNFTDFKKRNLKKKLKNWLISNSPVGRSIILNNLQSFQREQEIQADTFAHNFFTKNGYSPQSIVETFVNFNNLTKKYSKLLQGTWRPNIYSSIHPSDEERIQNANNFFKGKNISGRKFQVDSVTFREIKKRAIDETIYLLFEELRYGECLEMAYLQYLYNPTDEFYLFFVTECLRRQKLIDENFGEEFFITANYRNLSSSENLPVISVLANNNKKVSKKNLSQSIFANLQSEIYNLTENDLKNIKARELLLNDTIEFLTNNDALAYFTKKISKGACIFNLLRMLNSDSSLVCENIKDVSELENEYQKVGASYKYLKQKITSYKKSRIWLFNIDTYTKPGGKPIYDYNHAVVNEIGDEYYSIAKYYEDSLIDTKNKFNFRELNKIRNTTSLIQSLFADPPIVQLYSGSEKKNCDLISILPEMTPEINKYNYKKLILFEIITVNAPSKADKDYTELKISENWIVVFYTVDFDKKTVRKITKNYSWINSKDRNSKITKILETCLKEAAR